MGANKSCSYAEADGAEVTESSAVLNIERIDPEKHRRRVPENMADPLPTIIIDSYVENENKRSPQTSNVLNNQSPEHSLQQLTEGAPSVSSNYSNTSPIDFESTLESGIGRNVTVDVESIGSSIASSSRPSTGRSSINETPRRAFGSFPTPSEDHLLDTIRSADIEAAMNALSSPITPHKFFGYTSSDVTASSFYLGGEVILSPRRSPSGTITPVIRDVEGNEFLPPVRDSLIDQTEKESVGGSVLREEHAPSQPDPMVISVGGPSPAARPQMSHAASAHVGVNVSFSENNPKLPKRIYMNFTQDEDDPWGAAVDFSSNIDQWYVTEVVPEEQFGRKGVKKGWRILEVNQIVLTESTQEKIEDILLKGEGCIIRFERNSIKQKSFKMNQRSFSYT